MPPTSPRKPTSTSPTSPTLPGPPGPPPRVSGGGEGGGPASPWAAGDEAVDGLPAVAGLALTPSAESETENYHTKRHVFKLLTKKISYLRLKVVG